MKESKERRSRVSSLLEDEEEEDDDLGYKKRKVKKKSNSYDDLDSLESIDNLGVEKSFKVSINI